MKVTAFFEVRTSDKSHVKIRKLITSKRASFCGKRDTHTNLSVLEFEEYWKEFSFSGKLG